MRKRSSSIYIIATLLLLLVNSTDAFAAKRKVYMSYILHGNMNYDRYVRPTIWRDFPIIYDNLLDFMDEHELEEADLVGFSDGGNIALLGLQGLVAVFSMLVPATTVVAVILGLIFRFTTLGLYTQTVGINQRAARLNGISPTLIKLVSFLVLGVCCAVAGCISVSRLSLINHETMLLEIEMDAILAVAIGGNALGGGKFKVSSSVLGAYAIQALTITLYAMKVPSTDVKAYKAIVIILIVVIGSPVVKAYFSRLWARLKKSGKGMEAV